MKFKKSAGLFVTGVTFLIAGPLLIFIGSIFGAGTLLMNTSSEFTAVVIGVNLLGGLLSLIGSILLIGATYRALVKIDALPVLVPTSNRQNWPAERD